MSVPPPKKKEKEKRTTSAFGRLLIRKSVGGERRAFIRIIALNTLLLFRAFQRFGGCVVFFSFFFLFFQKSMFLQDLILLDCCRCVVELINTECTLSPSIAFDMGYSLGIRTFILNTRR